VADATPERTQAAMPRSAFASYLSGDAQIVAQRLSTLARWRRASTSSRIAWTCVPAKFRSPDGNARHRARGVPAVLVAPGRATASPWVRWEHTTALERKDVDAILPMPIEDPAIATPPPELAERHLRNRFVLAGYALAKVHEVAKRSGRILGFFNRTTHP
jgi:hypothetical protein